MSSEAVTNNRNSLRLNEILTVNDLLAFKAELLKEFRNILKEQTGKPTKKWLKTEEVKKLLGISTGKLQTLRINGKLPFTRIGGVLYYDADDIEQMFSNGKLQHT